MARMMGNWNKTVFKAPKTITTWEDTVFLAGTIDMGSSEDWQEYAIKNLQQKGFNVLSPRREKWDNSIEQSIDNRIFKEQVDWELEGLESSTYRFFNFLTNSKSPITLMELGLVCNMSEKHRVFTFVLCPNEFYRSGNVHIMCARYGIKYFTTDMNDVFDKMLMHRYSGILSKNKPLTIFD